MNKTLIKRRKIVKDLKKIKLPEQRSDEWYKMRSQMITASDFGSILGHNKYSSAKQVLKTKCGLGKIFEGNIYTRWGQKYEPVVTEIYEFKNKEVVHEFGCLQHPKYSFIGASPDGITDNGRMIEIKVPSTREIKDDDVPQHYYDQMQGQLEVCNLDECDFVQCKIEEYSYFKYSRDKESEFKGCVINTTDGHIYSPLNISLQELELWLKDKKKELDNIEDISYWKLIKYSNQMVKRDDMWMKDSLPILEKFWKDVCYYREHMVELEAYCKKRTRQK